MSLELKIYAFIAFFTALFFLISYIRYVVDGSRLRFKYYTEDELFGGIARVLGAILIWTLAIRLITLIAILWFDIKC